MSASSPNNTNYVTEVRDYVDTKFTKHGRGANNQLINTIYTSIGLTFTCIILLSNTAVFTIFHHFKKDLKQKIPNILLINQAVVDFIIGLSIIPRVICLNSTCPNFNFMMHKFLGEYTVFLAVMTLIVCTIERFLCVKYPFMHRVYATRGKVKLILLAMWLIATLPAIFLLVAIKALMLRYYHLITAVILSAGIALVFTFLAFTFRAISKSIVDKINKMTSETDLSNKNIAAALVAEQKKKAKVTKVFLLMAIIYSVTVMPSVLGNVVLDGLHSNRTFTFLAKQSLFLFYICSSMINPFLTIVCKPDFKAIVKVMFRKNSGNNANCGNTANQV